MASDMLPSRYMFSYQETNSSAPLTDWKSELKAKETARSDNFDPNNYKKPIWLQPSCTGGSGIVPTGGQEFVRGMRAYNPQQRSTVNPVIVGTLDKEPSSARINVFQNPDYDPIQMRFRTPVKHVDSPSLEVPFARHLRKERLHPDPNCLYYPQNSKASGKRIACHVEPVNNHLSHKVDERQTGIGAINPSRLKSHMRGCIGPSEVDYFPPRQSRRHVRPSHSNPEEAQDPISGVFKNPGREAEYKSKLEQQSRTKISGGRDKQYIREGPVNVILMTDKKSGQQYKGEKKTGIKLRPEWGAEDQVDKLLHQV